jgi:heterodisulfide reductase subunit D
MTDKKIIVPLMADLAARGEKPEYLFWVGCAGAYDDRYKKVTRAFAKLLTHMGISYAVLGTEETCSGDPARRAGNEMLFQMQALTNIATFTTYEVHKIITICPHCFNIFKNEYPDLGGQYEVIHHTQFLRDCMNQGKLSIDESVFASKRISFHDPCYLGRANDEYDAPRELLQAINPQLIELKRNRSNSLCCGAGGAQMFKEAEKGSKEIFIERTEEILSAKPDIIATACPFCMTMISDGIKYKEKEDTLRNMDVAELIVETLGI